MAEHEGVLDPRAGNPVAGDGDLPSLLGEGAIAGFVTRA